MYSIRRYRFFLNILRERSPESLEEIYMKSIVLFGELKGFN